VKCPPSDVIVVSGPNLSPFFIRKSNPSEGILEGGAFVGAGTGAFVGAGTGAFVGAGTGAFVGAFGVGITTGAIVGVPVVAWV